MEKREKTLEQFLDENLKDTQGKNLLKTGKEITAALLTIQTIKNLITDIKLKRIEIIDSAGGFELTRAIEDIPFDELEHYIATLETED